jgi:CHAD domain-containing protein
LAYAFALEDRTLARGTRRIALEQVTRALDHIDRPSLPQPEAVHEVRKSVKKLRALLRLVRPGLAGHGPLDALLRDAARHVAALRDAAVLLDTLTALSPEGFAAIRAALNAAPVLGPDASAAALARCRSDLAEARRALKKLKLAGPGEEVLEAGLNITIRRAQSALREVLRDPASPAIHEFRKRVKDHLYHSRLLVPLWPALMEPHAAATDDLAETLGLMNDIAVFTDNLTALEVPEAERTEALALAEARHDRLMLAALPLAARLFAGDPDDLGERWCAWWAIWQAEAP